MEDKPLPQRLLAALAEQFIRRVRAINDAEVVFCLVEGQPQVLLQVTNDKMG